MRILQIKQCRMMFNLNSLPPIADTSIRCRMQPASFLLHQSGSRLAFRFGQKIKINVSETYYSQVKNGMKVDVKAEAYGDDAFSGVVTTVYPTVDASTHTFPVEITLHNADQRLRPGMFVRATLSFGTRHHTVVPDQAVVKQTGSGDYYVYEYDQNTRKVKHRQVQIGRRLGTEYEILEGLAAGVQVVVAGQNRLADGMAVEVIK